MVKSPWSMDGKLAHKGKQRLSGLFPPQNIKLRKNEQKRQRLVSMFVNHPAASLPSKHPLIPPNYSTSPTSPAHHHFPCPPSHPLRLPPSPEPSPSTHPPPPPQHAPPPPQTSSSPSQDTPPPLPSSPHPSSTHTPPPNPSNTAHTHKSPPNAPPPPSKSTAQTPPT